MSFSIGHRKDVRHTGMVVVLGRFAPIIIKAKILLQSVWELKVDWDEEVPESIIKEWSLWHSQLKSFTQVHIPRCYLPKEAEIVSIQLYGFSDPSPAAYASVVYLHMTDSKGEVHRLSCIQNQSSSHKTSYYSKVGALWCLHSHQVDGTYHTNPQHSYREHLRLDR